VLAVHQVFVELKMREKSQVRLPGRPRAFDVHKALDCALQVFRRKGYEGASLSDLTAAMGINRPSLYAAFGDKEALFRRALDRYAETTMSSMREAFEEKTARGFVERLLRGAAEMQTKPGSPPGCLTVTGGLACGEESEPIRKELICRRGQVERLICDRLKEAKKVGELPAGSNPADLARYLATLIQGMAVQASAGATRAELHRVAETALRAWPNDGC
jgi:AcrR family transcriptional regulator